MVGDSDSKTKTLCPFHKIDQEIVSIEESKEEEEQQQQWVTPFGAGLSPLQIRSVFPYHIAVDSDFTVIQVNNNDNSNINNYNNNYIYH